MDKLILILFYEDILKINKKIQTDLGSKTRYIIFTFVKRCKNQKKMSIFTAIKVKN